LVAGIEDLEAFLVGTCFGVAMGLLQFGDVTAVRLAQGVQVIAAAAGTRDLFFQTVDGGLVIAALQIVAALLQGRLHGELRAQLALGILAAGRAAHARQTKQQTGARQRKESIPDHEGILALGLEG
jgi:hypothetical protein